MKAKEKIQEDICPMCASIDLHHGDKSWHGDQFCQEVICYTCEFEFRQWYKIAFDGMTVVAKDGTNVDIDSPIMRRFEFTIAINGDGENIDSAWTDAIESFGLDPGTPDPENTKVFEI